MAPQPPSTSTGARTEFTPDARGHQGSAVAGGPFRGLYLHIPFCFHKCHYCDFYSIVDQRDRQARFTEALIAELSHWAEREALKPRTIFVGGGTPTLLRPDLWQRLLAAMREWGILDAACEFTVEANPETVTDELLAVLAAGGVNRLSIGAQTFDPALLATLERWHEPASVERAVHAARGVGIDDLNLDLIFAIPGQTLAGLNRDLDALLRLEPTHLACYSLIFEPETPLTEKKRQGRIQPVAEALETRMYERVIDRLDTAGFEHYEISNWARRASERPGGGGWSSAQETAAPSRCQHNMGYWRNENWLGLGPSAASHRDGRRWKNVPHLGAYLTGAPQPPVVEDETLGADERIGEQLMLALRTRDGFREDWLNSSLEPSDPRWSALEDMLARGLLERHEQRIRLTRDGLFVADSVAAALL